MTAKEFYKILLIAFCVFAGTFAISTAARNGAFSGPSLGDQIQVGLEKNMGDSHRTDPANP